MKVFFGKCFGMVGFDVWVDVNGDGVVDICDLVFVV